MQHVVAEFAEYIVYGPQFSYYHYHAVFYMMWNITGTLQYTFLSGRWQWLYATF